MMRVQIPVAVFAVLFYAGCSALGPGAVLGPNELLISADGIGPAKISMTYDQLRAAMPYAEFEPTNYLVDTQSIAVNRGGERLMVFVFSADEDLTGDSCLTLLATENHRFRTMQGVGPGMPLSRAEAIYGKATLSFSYDDESREYATFANNSGPILFRPQPGKSRQATAGIYDPDPLTSQETIFKTNNYRNSAVISAVYVRRQELDSGNCKSLWPFR